MYLFSRLFFFIYLVAFATQGNAITLLENKVPVASQTNPTKNVPSSINIHSYTNRPWISFAFQLGIQFNSLVQRDRFADYSADYRAYRRILDDLFVDRYHAQQLEGIYDQAHAHNSKVLDPFQPVAINIPIGISLFIKTYSFLDLIFSTQSFWHEQVEVIEYQHVTFQSNPLGKGTQNITLKHGLQAHLGGIGVRIHLPTELISIDKSKPIILQIQRFWHIWKSEIYTNYGSLQANHNPTGNGFEISAGYVWNKYGPIQVSTYLSYLSLSFQSSQNWGALMPPFSEQSYSSENFWGINALKLQFQFSYIP